MKKNLIGLSMDISIKEKFYVRPIVSEKEKYDMSYSFSIITVLMQVISLLMVVLLVFALISGIRYFNWKKKNDVEIGKKLDKVIEMLSKDRS
ncbi:DUF4083 family protein [Paenibacillus sp. FSL H7-0331]|uniref:DUF4083 family protein n=2 Tax=Paenibacillus sp. FSL H7-0331 TaxID=1920421 RepID=UPI00118118D2|nr:DUF4083 family protein [Paenibacillus sp. FSL H7-0331]